MKSVGFVTADLVVVSGFITVYFIDGCICLFVTVDFMITIGIIGNLRGICIAMEHYA